MVDLLQNLAWKLILPLVYIGRQILQSDVQHYLLTATQPIAFLILAIIVSIAFSVWAYTRTNPPVTRPVRAILIALRSIGLAGGLWLLFQPVLQVNKEVSTPASVLILLDKSISMSFDNGGINRIEQINQLLDSKELGRLADRFTLKSFTFSDSIQEMSALETKSVAPEGIATDIGHSITASLDKISPDKPSLIILVSDGANNSGPDPARIARHTQVPITTIGIGSDATVFDLMITDVIVNPVVYQGSRIPVEVHYRAIGANGKEMAVRLRDPANKIIEKKTFAISTNFSEGKVLFDLPVDSAGRLVYYVEIPTQDDELTADNNRRSVTINSLTNRIRVLILSGTPDFALGDLVRRLKVNEHIEITELVERKGGFLDGNWPDGMSLSNTDVLIFHHFPTKQTNMTKLQMLRLMLDSLQTPICYFAGRDVDPTRLGIYSDLLPIEVNDLRPTIATGQVIPTRRHAVLAPPDEVDISTRWKELPPLSFFPNMYKVKANGEILAEATASNGAKSPILVVSGTGGRNSAAMLTSDFWKWGMFSPGSGGITEPLLDRLVKWLAIRRSTRKVQLSFPKDQFSTREVVSYRVVCFDEALQPFDGAEVTAKVATSSGEPLVSTLSGEGNGHYFGSFTPWTEGEYVISVSAGQNGHLLGEDRGTVSVEPYSVELLDSRLNKQLLQSISDGSGGRYLPVESAAGYFDSLNFPASVQPIQRSYELWGSWYHIAIVIAALALEWLIRVRIGML